MSDNMLVSVYHRITLRGSLSIGHKSNGQVAEEDKRKVPPHPDDVSGTTDVLDPDMGGNSVMAFGGKIMFDLTRGSQPFSRIKIGYEVSRDISGSGYPCDNRKLYTSNHYAYTYLAANEISSQGLSLQFNLEETREWAAYGFIGFRRSRYNYENGWDRWGHNETYQKFDRWTNGFVLGIGAGQALELSAYYDGDDRWGVFFTFGLPLLNSDRWNK